MIRESEYGRVYSGKALPAGIHILAVAGPLDDVQAALQKLMQRTPPLAAILPRQPGSRESRYAHLLSGPVEEAGNSQSPDRPQSSSTYDDHPGPNVASDLDGQITGLRQEVSMLQQEINDLKSQFASFRKQFE